MAKYRNITDQTLNVVCNGHPRGGSYGDVEPDQVLEVPDDVAAAHVWPETVWSEVEAPKDPEAAPRGKKTSKE